MTKTVDDMKRMNEAGMNSAMQMMGDWGKGWQAIAAEMTDYTRRSLEDGTQTLEKLMAARSFEQALTIQTTYAQRACQDYLKQVSKLGTIYGDLAKDAMKPAERAVEAVR